MINSRASSGAAPPSLAVRRSPVDWFATARTEGRSDMARVVVVHGINNTYLAPEVMAKDWVPALLSGVNLAGHSGLLARMM